MVQDVIDLRWDKWIPRWTDSKLKLINKIENDVKNEAIEQQSISLSYNRPEKRYYHWLSLWGWQIQGGKIYKSPYVS